MNVKRELIRNIVNPEWKAKVWISPTAEPLDDVRITLVAGLSTKETDSLADTFLKIPSVTAVEITDNAGNGVYARRDG